MRGRPFEVAWREPDTPETLKVVYQKERDPEVRTRRHGLWLLHCGWHLGRIAEAMGTHYGSVQRWVAWYRKDGLPEVQRHKMGGREPQLFLSPAAEFRVSDAVATGRFRTAWEIRDWIAQHYRASYTLGGVYSLLQRLKCAPKVPHPVHTKADREVQAAWEKGAPGGSGQSGSKPGNGVSFAEEMRMGLRGLVRQVCGRRGVKVQPTAPTGFHGWGANGGGSGRTKEAQGSSCRGLEWSAGLLGEMGKGSWGCR
jgi:transposase